MQYEIGLTLAVNPGFSLAATCGPVAWGRGRWPNVDWIDGALVWVGRERGDVVTRVVKQDSPGELSISGFRDPGLDETWTRRMLAVDSVPPVPTDPVVAAIARSYPGMRPYSSGCLFEGIVSCITGQSISVAAAAVTEARLCAIFHPGITMNGRRYWPMPLPEQIAAAEPALVRQSGVTWRRAEAIVAAAIAWQRGEFPTRDHTIRFPDEARAALLRLPLVGHWTAESALLWGIGLDDAFPPNDAALLRAARQAHDNPELTHADLILLSDGWRPARAWAARWLWTALLGPAPA